MDSVSHSCPWLVFAVVAQLCGLRSNGTKRRAGPINLLGDWAAMITDQW